MGLLSMTAGPMASGMLAALAVAFKPRLAADLVALARDKWRRCLVFGLSAVAAASVLSAVLLNVGFWAPVGVVAAAAIAAAAVAVPASGTLFKLQYAEQPYVCVAAGFAALTVASALPFVGALVQLAALAWGAGAIILLVRKEAP